MHTIPRPPDTRPSPMEVSLALLREQNGLLQTITERLQKLYELRDEAYGAYLNARFPYGRPTDRWGRR